MPTILPFRGVLPTIHASAYVADDAVVIGDVEIGPEAGIWFGCVLRGDVNHIRIGARTNLQDHTVVHVATRGAPALIGSDVTVGHCVLLHACTVEDGAFVGMRATVMDDAVVEAGAMVGAGALVTPGKRVAAGTLWLGNPAREKRPLSDEERADMDLTARRYVQLAQIYRGIDGGARLA